MKRAYLLSRRSEWLWRLLAVLLVVIGQLGIVSASLTLARDESSAISHAEESGTNLHHGHNEAACASCALLSMQTGVAHSATGLAVLAVEHLALAQSRVDRLSAPQHLTESSRAPPSEEV
jgi:hypothetical protein